MASKRGSTVHNALQAIDRKVDRMLSGATLVTNTPATPRGVQGTGLLLSAEELEELANVQDARSARRWSRDNR
jgi:hypothetical protein